MTEKSIHLSVISKIKKTVKITDSFFKFHNRQFLAAPQNEWVRKSSQSHGSHIILSVHSVDTIHHQHYLNPCYVVANFQSEFVHHDYAPIKSNQIDEIVDDRLIIDIE